MTPESLRELVADYLRVRRSLGYKLECTERLLFAYVDYLQAHDAQEATVEHALGFATAPVDASARWQALRLSAVRCFPLCPVGPPAGPGRAGAPGPTVTGPVDPGRALHLHRRPVDVLQPQREPLRRSADPTGASR
jgi:hypothetical protein